MTDYPPLPKTFSVRADALARRKPDLIAHVRFLRSEEGGREGPVPNGFGCPCKLNKQDAQANDARILFEQDWTPLGSNVTGKVFFDHGEDAARAYREAGHFYLWEGKIIAEADVI